MVKLPLPSGHNLGVNLLASDSDISTMSFSEQTDGVNIVREVHGKEISGL